MNVVSYKPHGINLWFEIPRHCGKRNSNLDGVMFLSSDKQIEFCTICYF